MVSHTCRKVFVTTKEADDTLCSWNAGVQYHFRNTRVIVPLAIWFNRVERHDERFSPKTSSGSPRASSSPLPAEHTSPRTVVGSWFQRALCLGHRSSCNAPTGADSNAACGQKCR